MNGRVSFWQVGRFAFWFLTVVLMTFSSIASRAGTEEFCTRPQLERLPVLAEGRVTPLFAHAERVRKSLFKKGLCDGLSSTALYCFISLGQRDRAEAIGGCSLREIKIDHVKTAELLGLDRNSKSALINWVRDRREELYEAYQTLEHKGEQDSGFASDLAATMSRIDLLDKLESGQDWKVLVAEGEWQMIRELRDGGASDAFQKHLTESGGFVSESERRSLAWESFYERSHPFALAALVCVVGFLISLVSIQVTKLNILVTAMLFILVLIEAVGLLARVMVSGRAPVTNMYETVLWSGLGLFIVSVILGYKTRDRRLWAIGFAGNAVCLLMMTFASNMLDASIKPLVPVLRDNFWLSTHVMTITFSYACFALSWLVGNYALVVWNFGKPSEDWLSQWNKLNRLTIQIGSVFLAAGIILGGVWADYSWGRFWGWDPKETWSLIALVVYMVILHGRYVGWFKGLAFTMAATSGFLFVLMAWFGVNYILAAGLHSYGFSSGGAAFLWTTLFAQLAVFALTAIRLRRSVC